MLPDIFRHNLYVHPANAPAVNASVHDIVGVFVHFDFFMSLYLKQLRALLC